MTEKEWLSSTDPGRMLALLGDRLSPRKRQLFACACVRPVWHLVEDATCRQALEVAERYADGLATAAERAAADVATAQGEGRDTPYSPAELAATFAVLADTDFAEVDSVLRHPAVNAARYAAKAATDGTAAMVMQAAALRDLVGPSPWGSLPSLDPALLTWNNGLIPRLARAAYDHQVLPKGMLDPACLAVLADALEESGGAPRDLLNHLRGPGVHWRGCWAVDWVLGKQ